MHEKILNEIKFNISIFNNDLSLPPVLVARVRSPKLPVSLPVHSRTVPGILISYTSYVAGVSCLTVQCQSPCQ